MYSDIFCKVYNEFGWNYYPEAFGEQLLQWMTSVSFRPETAMDLACGTGVLCEILHKNGIKACIKHCFPSITDFFRKIVARTTWHQPKLNLRALLWCQVCTHDTIDHFAQCSVAAQHEYLRTSLLFHQLARQLNRMIRIFRHSVYKWLTSCFEQLP